MASRLGPAKPRGRTWNAAGACDIRLPTPRKTVGTALDAPGEADRAFFLGHPERSHLVRRARRVELRMHEIVAGGKLQKPPGFRCPAKEPKLQKKRGPLSRCVNPDFESAAPGATRS